MAKMVNWNTAEFEAKCLKVSMDRLEAGARIIRDDAKRILAGKIKGPPVTRPAKGPAWMGRTPGAMIETIRVVRRKDPTVRNIWIMAGNWAVWWATQMEYGRGAWKGGPKPFLRPAMHGAASAIKSVMESGSGGTE
jgi:hypothetical protein